VRHRGSTKRRVWLGSGGYFCGCERRIANSDSDGNCNSHGYSDGHSYSYSNAQTDAHAQVWADTEASSHTAAQTIEIFATAKISSYP
jgi:hypothetical protein